MAIVIGENIDHHLLSGPQLGSSTGLGQLQGKTLRVLRYVVLQGDGRRPQKRLAGFEG